ncbi:MAG: hemerythrin domain-containing protein [Aeromicrobium sp.]
MASPLEVALSAEHDAVAQLAEQARSVVPTQDEPRIRYRLTDTFSSVLSRHLAAVEDVLLPRARRTLTDGQEKVHAYVHHARSLESDLHQLKAKLYGDATNDRATWDLLWDDIVEQLNEHTRHEMSLVHGLCEELDPEGARQLASELAAAEERAPTRPHPYTPHTGWMGRLAHRVWRIADQFWDEAEGRLIPHREPKPPARPDSLMHRYFTGAPPHRSEE